MKRYLLIAGQNYYPGQGDRDWVGFFDSEEEAKEMIVKSNNPYHEYQIIGRAWADDWYEIIDLENWKPENVL